MLVPVAVPAMEAVLAVMAVAEAAVVTTGALAVAQAAH